MQDTETQAPAKSRRPLGNKGKLIGAKPPLARAKARAVDPHQAPNRRPQTRLGDPRSPRASRGRRSSPVIKREATGDRYGRTVMRLLRRLAAGRETGMPRLADQPDRPRPGCLAVMGAGRSRHGDRVRLSKKHPHLTTGQVPGVSQDRGVGRVVAAASAEGCPSTPFTIAETRQR
jgi:hypothetical protein